MMAVKNFIIILLIFTCGYLFFSKSDYVISKQHLKSYLENDASSGSIEGYNTAKTYATVGFMEGPNKGVSALCKVHQMYEQQHDSARINGTEVAIYEYLHDTFLREIFGIENTKKSN